MRGAYPGTFDPPTIAHVAIAEAAHAQCGLTQLDLIVNRDPLGKDGMRPLPVRVRMLEAVAAARPWMTVVVTTAVHLADIADGYDVLVLGADKWAQLLDPVFYESKIATAHCFAEYVLTQAGALAETIVSTRGDDPLLALTQAHF